MASLIVYKGDDTSGTFGRHLQFTINVEEGVSLVGCVASFTVNGITKTWGNITPGKQVEIVYTHDETASMPLGATYGIFRITDANNNVRTFDDAIPFAVTDDIRQVYPGASSATVIIGFMVKWDDIQKPLTQSDVFDMNCNDWEFRKKLAKTWEKLGGKVINND